MKKILLFAATVMLLAVSCNKENEATGRSEYGNAKEEKTVFHATTEGTATPGTKVYADEDLRLLWNANDRISVFNKNTTNAQYMFQGEDGDNSGDFEEVASSGPIKRSALDYIYAVYPFAQDITINNTGTQINVTLPEVQTYREHSFGLGANTMVAVADNNYLSFKNVCGYLKFRFYGDNVKVKSVKFEGNNGEKISGYAYITPSATSTPTVAMDNAASTKITMNCTDAVTLGTSSTDFTEFIFVIPPTVFSGGFKVTVTDESGDVFEKSSTRSLTITRNKMESMGVMKVTPVPVEPLKYKLVTDYSDLTEGSEFIIVSTANDKAMATQMWSYPWRKDAGIVKSSDKSTIENPDEDVQVFTLKKGSAAKTVMLECKNGEFASKYLGALITSSPSSNNAQWTYLYNCEATETSKGISWTVTLEESGDALITPYNTQSRFKYLAHDNSNKDFKMDDAYLASGAVAIYKLEGSGEGGEQLVTPDPEFHFTGASYPAGYEGMYYVNGTTTLPKTGGTYTIEYEIKYPVDGGFVQSDNSQYSYSNWYDWTLDKQVADNKVVVTVPENTTGSLRSAYFIMEYSYKVDGVWQDVRVMIYLAQLG